MEKSLLIRWLVKNIDIKDVNTMINVRESRRQIKIYHYGEIGKTYPVYYKQDIFWHFRNKIGYYNNCNLKF
jgi:hypothetical protein